MKLYSMAPQDCSGKVRWLLNEMNVPCEEVRVSYRNGDLKTPEYLAKHPLGQVPVLEVDGLTLFESYAIVQYLADKYPEKAMAPTVTNLQERAVYNQWMWFCANSVENFFTRHQRLSKMTEEYKAEWGVYIQDKMQKVLSTLENHLQDKKYILGSFSAVDTCFGYALDSVSEESFFNDYPATKAYYTRLAEREACLKSEIFKRS